jgi:hypothetical protein
MDPGGCYCARPEISILKDLIDDTLPDEALLSLCCWKEISRVRGLNRSAKSYVDWTGLCRRRGNLYRYGSSAA